MPSADTWPRCPWCGCKIKRRTHHEDLWLPKGERPAPYAGNLVHIADRFRYSTGDVYLNRQPQDLWSRILWDGESYGVKRYLPFCSMRCGLAFGKSTHRAGYRREGTF